MLKRKIVFFAFILVIGALTYRFIFPSKKTHSANFTGAKATLLNSRYSYKASVATGTSGSPTVVIDTDSGDDDTNHLFPKDPICFVNADQSGCYGNVGYVVASTVNSTTFNTTGALGTTLATTDFVVATQSGSLVLNFTTVTEVPVSGDLVITIPAVQTANKTADGIPDTAATVAENGFDIKGIVAGDISITGCTDGNWGAATITAATGANDHTISFTRVTTACAASTAVQVTIDATPGLINPAPTTAHSSRGQSEAYTINILTRDITDNTLDQSDVAVAIVEGVLISATVDETLSLLVAAVTDDSGAFCGVSRTGSSPDSFAYAVPWGTISSTYGAATHNANQQLTVSTNASAGYSVFVEENDQMGKDGNTCTGTAPSAGDFTFSAGTCIRDTLCEGTCSESSETEWTNMATYVGLGYSMEDTSGTDATFEYDDPANTGTFKARQFADVYQGGETRAAIMTNTGPVSGSSAYVCFRIAITGLQPAGYYYNNIKYTAIPIF